MPNLQRFLIPDTAPDAPGQLYDLENDPGETKNLASRYPERVSRMARAIVKWNASMPKDAGDPGFVGN